MPEIAKVYVCVVCSKRYDSLAALGGHMRWHREDEYIRTSFSAKKVDYLLFKAMCDKHGTTTCSMLRALMDAAVAGEKMGMVTVGSQNPVMVQVNHVVLGAPRGRYSHVDVEKAMQSLRAGEFAGAELTAAVSCKWLNHYEWVSGRIGFCRRAKRWVTPEICVGCVKK